MAGLSPSTFAPPLERDLYLQCHRMCAKYNFEKPNDRRALDLMNAAAKAVVADVQDITLAYGVSDEYSFIFHKSTSLFERRER